MKNSKLRPHDFQRRIRCTLEDGRGIESENPTIKAMFDHLKNSYHR